MPTDSEKRTNTLFCHIYEGSKGKIVRRPVHNNGETHAGNETAYDIEISLELQLSFFLLPPFLNMIY